MKFPVLLLSSLMLGTTLVAQSTSSAALRMNNEPYLVISTAKDPNTGRNYLWPPTLPAAYSASATAGVTANTWQHRWFPDEAFRTTRSAANTSLMMVNGVRYPIATSGGTSTFPYSGYVPETKFSETRLLTGKATDSWGGGRKMTADLSKAFITLPETAQSFGSAGYFIVTRTLSTALPLADSNNTHVDEFAMSMKWKGGEHRTKDGSQGYFASYADGMHPNRTVQFEDPSGSLTEITTDFAITWLQPMFEDLMLYTGSDWGYRRTAAVVPTITGQSIATSLADLGTNAGQVRIRTDGGTATAGETVVFLMDFSGSPFPSAINIPLLGGFDLRLNPGNPVFGALLSYGGTSDSNGQYWNGAWLNLPSVGAAGIGSFFGFQAISVDTSALTATSSNAQWIEIDR